MYKRENVYVTARENVCVRVREIQKFCALKIDR